MSDTSSFKDDDLTSVELFNLWLTRRAILKRIHSFPKNMSVLELGSGYYARNLGAIEDKFESLTAVDFQLSEALKKRKKFHCIEKSIEEAIPSLKEKAFDLILLLSVLEHLEDPLKVLKACYYSLKKGGLLIVLVPNWAGKRVLECIAFKFNASLTTRESINDHKMYYGKRDLWPLLIKSGFIPSHVSLSYKKFGFTVFAQCTK